MKAYFVGAGCGTPRNLTNLAIEKLKNCDVVIYDDLIHPDILQLAERAIEFFRVGKRREKHYLEQSEINNLILKKFEEGKIVVRLKGGDPTLFGRLNEEIENLPSESYEVIPGISAHFCAFSDLKISQTQRKTSNGVYVLTGTDYLNKVPKLECVSDQKTIVFYMGISKANQIAKELLKYLPASTPVALIYYAGWYRKEVILTNIEKLSTEMYITEKPGIILIGDVLKNAFIPPRSKYQVFVFRLFPESYQLAREIEKEFHIDAFSLPLLKEEKIGFNASNLNSADWVVVTSPRAANILKIIWNCQFSNANLVAVGLSTKKTLEDLTDKLYVPKEKNSYGILDFLKENCEKNSKIVIFSNEDFNSKVLTEIKTIFQNFEFIPTYRTVENNVEGFHIYERLYNEDITNILIFGSGKFCEIFSKKFPLRDNDIPICWGRRCFEKFKEIFGYIPYTLNEPTKEALFEMIRSILSKR